MSDPATREEAVARLRADAQRSYDVADAFMASLPDDQRARMARAPYAEPSETWLEQNGHHPGCGCL